MGGKQAGADPEATPRPLLSLLSEGGPQPSLTLRPTKPAHPAAASGVGSAG